MNSTAPRADTDSSIVVIGAGSVGVSTALHLQQRGWKVTLIDRRGVAMETSFGNAGVINASSMVPLNNPDLHVSLARLLRNNTPELRYRWRYVLKHLPWVLEFLKASKTRAATHTSSALFELTSRSLDEHRALMQRAGNQHRMTQNGWLKVYRQGPGFNPDSFLAEQLDNAGLSVTRLSADDIHQMEPALKRIYTAGYLLDGAAQINNPNALLSEYADVFAEQGGEIRLGEVRDVQPHGNAFRLQLDDDVMVADRLVIAAGPWSADLLTKLGLRVPLGYERGYHAHFHAPRTPLTRSVHDVQGGFIAGPMVNGDQQDVVRVTTGVELNDRDAPSNTSQLEQIMPALHEALDIGERTQEPVWRGCRPTLPDSLPIIGPAPGKPNLWLAFGHQHIGLMTGPITGRILAERISGETPEVDLHPFRAERYIRG